MARRSSHADGKALLRSCCLVVELDVEAAPEYLLFRGVRKRIRSAQPPLRSKIKNGAGQSQFPKETATCLHWYGGCSMIVENERSVRQLERRQRFKMK